MTSRRAPEQPSRRASTGTLGVLGHCTSFLPARWVLSFLLWPLRGIFAREVVGSLPILSFNLLVKETGTTVPLGEQPWQLEFKSQVL